MWSNYLRDRTVNTVMTNFALLTTYSGGRVGVRSTPPFLSRLLTFLPTFLDFTQIHFSTEAIVMKKTLKLINSFVRT